MIRSFRVLLVVITGLAVPTWTLAQTTISGVSAPGEMRVMDWSALAVEAVGDGSVLQYQWTVVSHPSGTAPKLVNSSSSSARLELWWASESTAAQAVGKDVVVQVAVWSDGEPAVTEQSQIRVSAVNNPPVPSMKGDFGTPTERLAPGTSVKPRSTSTDPDGDSPRIDWGFGSKTGGRYPPGQPVLYGSNGATPSFIVPEITADIDQEIFVQLTNGLHSARAIATVYMKPSEGSKAPSLTAAPSVVSVTRGETATLKANATDLDGDNLTFTWTFLQSSVSTQVSSVNTRTSSTSWESIATVPTQDLIPGTYRISVQATESSTSFGLSSNIGYVDLVVGSAGPSNQEPTARIMYDANGDGQLSGPATPGATIQAEDRSVTLDGSASVDEGSLKYLWSLEGDGSLSSSTAAQTVLTVAEGWTGTVNVNLRVEDSGGLTGTTSVKFAFDSVNDNPVAVIRFGEGTQAPTRSAAAGATVQVGSRTLRLDGTASEDDGGPENLIYTWSAGGSFYNGYLSSTTGPEVTLTVPEESSSSIKVSLKVRDEGGKSAETSLTFSFVESQGGPEAKILFDDDGDGLLSGPFSGGHVVQAASRTVTLDGSASTAESGSLTYHWSASGIEGLEVSPSQGAKATLTVPSGSEGTVTVELTVEDEDGLTGSSSIQFVYARSSGGSLSLEVTSEVDAVEAGEEFVVRAFVEGVDYPEDLAYEWRAEVSDGGRIEVFSSGVKARVRVPSELSDGEETTLTVRVRAREGETVSDWAETQVLVTGPRLFFSHLGVGRIQGTRLRFGTSVVLVNSCDDEARGRLVFTNNAEGENWSLLVDGVETSELEFTVPAGGSKKYFLSGDEVEVGWVRLTSNVKVVGHLFYLVEDIDTGAVVKEVPILPVVGSGFRTALDPGANLDVALALVNVGDEDIHFKVIARTVDGAVVETREMLLVPGEHVARFIPELFDGYENSGMTLQTSFPGGTLQIQAVEGDARFVATIMKTTEAGLPQSILPVAQVQ